MNILLTGSTGFIGSALLKCFLGEGNRVFCIIRPESRNIAKIPVDNQDCVIIKSHFNDFEKIKEQIDRKIDAVYHLAWEGIRSKDRENEQLQSTNYDNSLALMNLAINLKVSKFIGIGSQAEYGIKENIDDNTEENPLSFYGVYKQKTHYVLSDLARKNDIKFYWARVFSVYGLGDDCNSLIMKCIAGMLKNEDISLTHATQKWDYLHIDDLVSALNSFILYDVQPGRYNIAEGNSRPLKDYIETIKEVTHSTSNLLYGVIPYSTQGIVSLNVSILNTMKKLNWSPKMSFRVGIEGLISNMQRGN